MIYPIMNHGKLLGKDVCKGIYLLGIVCLCHLSVAADVPVFCDTNAGGLKFAADEIRNALAEKGNKGIIKNLDQMALDSSFPKVVLATVRDIKVLSLLSGHGGLVLGHLEEEGYSIRVTGAAGKKIYWAIGADTTGAMYGGLELSETIQFDGLNSVIEGDHNRHLPKRGIKLNVPLDARTPSYADAGSAAQTNIKEMWSMDFWSEHLDNLARNRYNCITMWNLHPFPSLVKVPDYPDIALENVTVADIDWKAWWPNNDISGHKMAAPYLMDNLKVIKTMTMDQKIAHWREVMQYAHDRGIEFYIYTWNIFTHGTFGQYGITSKRTNSTTEDYFRKSVRALFETYPLLAGIGITAGENLPGSNDEKEEWLWNAYGRGVNEALASQPGRSIRFIHRYWMSDMHNIVQKFSGLDNDVSFDFSFKYSKARLYSRVDPNFEEGPIRGLPAGKKFWWNLRNDDIFNFRWGDPAFSRALIKNFPPLSQTIGFHMGSDGYVWGREFTSTEPENPRQLETDKHWYRFMLWGRLGYNPELPDSHFKKAIAHKFPGVDAELMFELWQAASKIIPTVNNFHWHNWDWEWTVEYGKSKKQKGFHFIDHECWNHGGGNAAYDLKALAAKVFDNIDKLRGKGGKELRLTLGDIEAMAHLGNYYSEKSLAADNALQAADHLAKAAGHWRRYTNVASRQYEPQLGARNGWCDWKELYADVLTDITLRGGSRSDASLAATPGGTILEAEEGEITSGSVSTTDIGYTGAGFVDFNHGSGDATLELIYDAPEAGYFSLQIRYAMPSGESTMGLTINGQNQGIFSFWYTGGNDIWMWDPVTVYLQKGYNTIRLEVGDKAPHIDHVNVLYKQQ